MIKRIINSILWRSGISRALPPLVWKPVTEDELLTIHSLKKRHPKFKLNFDDDRIVQSFRQQNKLVEEVSDYILEMDNVLVEPVRGLAILSRGRFVAQTREHKYFYPGTWNYIKYKVGIAPTLALDKAIHFDGYVGENYYNFHADILCSFLWAIKNVGMNTDMPILIGKKVFNLPYVQSLFAENEWFRNLPWHILDERTFIIVKKLYKAKIFTFEGFVWRYAADLRHHPKVQDPQRRIFLYRAANVGRGIKNMDEIRPILKKNGFEMIDTATMPVKEQADIFANTRYLIAVHGAGIVNMIYSSPLLSLLEILPGRTKLNPCFYRLSERLGNKYDAILTEDMNARKRFRLDAVTLEKHIKKMLSESPNLSC